jgi:hypothetical protein
LLDLAFPDLVGAEGARQDVADGVEVARARRPLVVDLLALGQEARAILVGGDDGARRIRDRPESVLDGGARRLAAVGGRQLDAAALRKIGEKYGVDAIFIGNVAYSDPRTDVKVTDSSKLEGSLRVEVRGDISGRLVETRSGANVWSSSAWARRPVGGLNVSEQGVSGGMRRSNPREEMVPTLVYHLTQDFRATSVRQQVK